MTNPRLTTRAQHLEVAASLALEQTDRALLCHKLPWHSRTESPTPPGPGMKVRCRARDEGERRGESHVLGETWTRASGWTYIFWK